MDKPPRPIYVAVLSNGFPAFEHEGRMVADCSKKLCELRCERFWGLAYKHAKKAKAFRVVKFVPAK